MPVWSFSRAFEYFFPRPGKRFFLFRGKLRADVRDYVVPAGKDALGDLYEGKRSLPIIHLLSTSTGPDHDFLRRFLKDERTERSPSAVHEVRALLEQYGSVAFATSRARQFAIEARNRFDETFAPTPSSPALDFLREMIDFMVDRRF